MILCIMKESGTREYREWDFIQMMLKTEKSIYWDRYQISGCLVGGYGLIKERFEGVLWAYWNVLYFKCSG